LEVFTVGLLDAESRGKAFVYRTAASFVRVRAGIRPRDLLDRDTIAVADCCRGGLFVVGSYVPKTSAQLEILIGEKNVAATEVNVDHLLNQDRQTHVVTAAIAATDQALEAGLDAVVYTSRDLVTGADAGSSLEIGRQVSDSLIAIIQGIHRRPRYVVAKGGITSSDIVTVGLKARRAMIMGQVLPGVPVWRLGPETRWPDLTYVVFPGNVGTDLALVDVRRRLRPMDGPAP
jgi:uncharacterized protein YgbK (DUF1537 family)